MACSNDGDAGTDECGEQLQERAGIFLVKVRDGFVGKNDDGAIDDCTRQKYELTLSSGERCGRERREVANAALFERQKCTTPSFREAFLGCERRQHDVFVNAAII